MQCTYLMQTLQPSRAPVLFMETHASNVKSSWIRQVIKKANNNIILLAITCVAWPCCCSCCSCCAVRKLTGLFPAISFVPAGIVVRMIFLPKPLMLRTENCWKVNKQQSRLVLQIVLQLLGDCSYLANLLMILIIIFFCLTTLAKTQVKRFCQHFSRWELPITQTKPSNSELCLLVWPDPNTSQGMQKTAKRTAFCLEILTEADATRIYGRINKKTAIPDCRRNLHWGS